MNSPTEDYDVIIYPAVVYRMILVSNIAVPTFNGHHGDLGEVCDVVVPWSVN